MNFASSDSVQLVPWSAKKVVLTFLFSSLLPNFPTQNCQITVAEHKTQTNMSNSACGDGANSDLDASLLLKSKYTKIWRRSYYIGILISLKKSTTSNASSESPPPSPQPSSSPHTPLPLSETPATTSSSKSYVSIDIASDADKDNEEGVDQIIQRIGRIVKEKDLESLRELGGVGPVCSILCQHRQPSKVLTETNIAFHGTSFFRFLWSSCKRNIFTIALLLFSAVLSFIIEFKQEGPRYGWHDGAAIVIALVLLVSFPSVTNFWREKKTVKLSKRKFKVQRGEEGCLSVAMSEMLVGDIVYLSKGQEVPADGLFLDGENFGLDDETSCRSDCERNPFVIAGSKVIEGDGRMVVTSVGNKRSLAERRRGLLDGRIEKPISCIDNFSLFVFVLAAVVVLIRLLCKKDSGDSGLPELKGKVSVGMLMEVLEKTILRPQGRISVVAGLVTAAILCIQHGMPLAVTISLGCRIDKDVSGQDVVLNDLSACTTMGLVTVICVDVSGGLISEPMEVRRIRMGEKDICKVEGSEINQVVLDKLQQGVCSSVLVPELPLSAMSISLISWAETTWGKDMNSFAEEFKILRHSKLNSDTERIGVLVRKVGENEQDLHLHWSGAASLVLDMCSQYYDSNGECHEMENQKSIFEQVIKEMEDSDLKPVAFAHKQAEVQELDQDELILLGVIGLKQTCPECIKYIRSSGIEIKLVSEDDIMVVEGIASELGIELQNDGNVLEGKVLQDLSSRHRLDKVNRALIMGSFSPEDMILMVECLQEKGHVVAFVGKKMTPSRASILREADVGVVLDSLGGTIANRESFGITIKCLAALEQIVRSGRSNYNNIQKFIQLQIIFGISGSLITLITTIFTGGSPLTGVQLIWVNVIMFLLGGLMMVMEFSDDEQQLAVQSSDRNQSIITREIWKSIVIQVSYQVSASMILEFVGHVTEREKLVRETMIFNTFLLCQVFNLLNTMHLSKWKVLKIVLRNYCFLVALALCFLMQVLMVGYAKGLANCIRLSVPHWALCVLVGFLSCVFEWTLKKLTVIISTNYASGSNSSPSAYNRSNWIYLPWAFPVVMLFSLPLIFGQMEQIFP